MKFAGPLLVLIGAFVDDQRILQLPVLAIVVYWLWRCTWDVFYGPSSYFSLSSTSLLLTHVGLSSLIRCRVQDDAIHRRIDSTQWRG